METVLYNEGVKFNEWITKKYVEWRGERIGKGISIADFAAEFGASQPVMSNWMRPGSNPPRSQAYIKALYKKYGDEVIEVLGIQQPDSSPHQISLDQVPSELRSLFEAAITELTTSFTTSGIDPDSPAGLAMAKEIFGKHGFNVTVKSNEKSG